MVPRHAYHGWWHDASGADLDEGLCLIMPGPRSYTGEDVAELQLHGGALNLRRCLEVCWSAGARPADPGEFTRRAYLNGRLDLTRAEAIADLIAARTDRALAQARAHLSGRLEHVITAARDRVLELRARLEVNIDFIEEDVPLMDPTGLATDARAIAAELGDLAATWERGHLIRDGARVVIAGPPNAGKSSLFNALCRRDRAIVTAVAGTTRDVLEETLDVLGVPVVLVDTAGLRATEDTVEAVGIARARAQLVEADLTLWLVDPTADARSPTPAGALALSSKCDLAGPVDGMLAVSATTGAGLADLERAIVERLGGAVEETEGLVISRDRHRLALLTAVDALRQAATVLEEGEPPELAAVDVQEATDALGAIVGVTTIEDMLDRLFAAFCIGK